MHKVIDKTTGSVLYKGTEKDCIKFKKGHFAKRFLMITKGE